MMCQTYDMVGGRIMLCVGITSVVRPHLFEPLWWAVNKINAKQLHLGS